MRYARLFGKTVRETPHEVRSRSQALLIKAGYIRPLGRGLVSELPLATRVIGAIVAIIRDEMERLGGQEVSVPLINPFEIWRRGGRDSYLNKDMIRFSDRDGHKLTLAPSHEEAMVQLVKDALHSYRDLPLFLYQFQTKFRDEDRVRSGLIRAKEFIMKDGYSFHRTTFELNNFFPKMFSAYQRIFARCGIECLSAESGVGYMGGQKAYEFLMPAESGDNTVVICDSCGYQATSDIAMSIKEINSDEKMKELESAETPGCTTMKSLAKHLGVDTSRLAKVLVYRVGSGFAMAVVRGDYDISVEKLSTHLKSPVYGLASAGDLESLELIPGYLSPIGREDMPVVVDDAISQSRNLVYGSNRKDIHLLNGNYDRDFSTNLVCDIAQVNTKDRCLQCHSSLRAERAIEVGNIFKLGDLYTRRMNLQVQDERSNRLFPIMGSYGIGLGRLLSCIVEANSDDRGIRWPEHLAPYRLFLMGIGKSLSVKRYVEDIYQQFEDETLLDDRLESPGVKFQDADLLGIPLRIVVSPGLLEKNKVELQERLTDRKWQVPADRLASVLLERIEGEENV